MTNEPASGAPNALTGRSGLVSAPARAASSHRRRPPGDEHGPRPAASDLVAGTAAEDAADGAAENAAAAGDRSAAELLALIEARDQLQALVQAAPVGFAVFDHALRPRVYNDRLAEAHGLSVADLVGVGLDGRTVLPGPAEVHERALRHVLETGERLLDVEVAGPAPADPAAVHRWLVSYYPIEAGARRGVAASVVDITDRHELLQAERAARTEAQRAEAQLARLTEISDAALGSLSLDELLEELMQRLRYTLRADTVRILLLSDDGATLAGGGALGGDVGDDIAVPVGQGVIGGIAATRQPVVVDDLRTVESQSPLLADVRSLAGVPMLAADRLVGVLHVGTYDQRRFDEADVELLELAAERIAVAIERARSYDFERRARERFEFVTAVNDALARSLDQREIMQFVTRAAVPRLGDWALLFVLAPGAESTPVFELAHTDPTREAYARDIVAALGWRPDAPFGAPAVVRTGRPEWHRDVPVSQTETLRAADPRLAGLLALPVTSLLIVPLRAGGRVLGALQLTMSDTGRRFTRADVELAEDVAARVAAALENARLFEEQRSIALTLQRALLPDRLPDVPGLDVAARYRPAAGGQVGGDFYDVKDVGDGSWVVSIGDVSGKGIPAAAVTAMARYTLSAVSPLDPSPSASLRRLHNELLARRSEQYCTALAVTLRARDGGGFDVQLAAGGHPLPVLVPAGGGPARFVGRYGTILGFIEPVRLHDVELVLASGDTLVLYTDGATDLPPPGAIDDETLLELVAAAAACPDATRAAAALDDAIAARHGGVVHSDDLALVVLRVT